MNHRLPRLVPGLLAVAIATGGFAVAVQAQTATSPAAPAAAAGAPMPPPHGPGGPGRHGRRMAMQLDRLKTSLKLDAAQTRLWERAQAQMVPPQGGGERMKGQHERMTAMLDDPAFDPRKLAAEMDAADGERRTRTTGMRDAWIAVYDALNPVQRGQVREFLRARMGKRGMGDHRGGEHMGMRQHGDGGPRPMPPGAPMPPAAPAPAPR